ncbi:hypothetical protein P7C73_g6632, partial [Tremellales sp. Uapishka_1]
MDHNRVPSSPLQHHRSSSVRHNPAQPSDAIKEATEKLVISRPSQPHCPAVASSSSWAQEQPSTTSFVEHQADLQLDTTFHFGTRTQPLASSSKCPSPHTVVSDLPEPEAHLAQLTSVPAGLCTSEPLNRSSSNRGSPIISSHPLKRQRASSLPAATPDFKRFKSRHTVPSEPRTHHFEAASTLLTPAQRKQAQAAELGRHLTPGRAARRSNLSLLVAAKTPPINVKTLKSLEAGEILQNPQLRHDLLFDSLAFRPVNPSQSSVLLDGKTPVDTAVAIDMYWTSIKEEIEAGCRCTRWKIFGGLSTKGNLETKEKVNKCVCGAWQRHLSEKDWWASMGEYPSRIPELVKTLREILISLMGSTTPCPNHFTHSYSRESIEAHEKVCPTVQHALVPELYAALDPEFLTARVRRGVFGISIFQLLGEAMKVHCAPVRDSMVDEMVRTAMNGDVALGLRKCFDCVEIMKLDIANHQVHALRPYLWTTAIQHETMAFQSILASSGKTAETSVTRDWLRAQSKRILAASEPSERVHLTGTCSCKSNMELVMRSLAEGFTQVVFDDETLLPETLNMDSKRLRAFRTVSTDIVITQMLLLVFKELLLRHHTLSPTDLAHQLQQAQIDIDYVMDSLGKPASGNDVSDMALRLATRIVRPFSSLDDDCSALLGPNRETNEIMALAQVVDIFIRNNVHPGSDLFKSHQAKLAAVLTMMLSNSLLANRNDPTSPLYDAEGRDDRVCQTQGQAPVLREPGPKLNYAAGLREKHNLHLRKMKALEEDRMKKDGLEVVESEIRDLVGKMMRIVTFNLQVHVGLYSSKGFTFGS